MTKPDDTILAATHLVQQEFESRAGIRTHFENRCDFAQRIVRNPHCALIFNNISTTAFAMEEKFSWECHCR